MERRGNRTLPGGDRLPHVSLMSSTLVAQAGVQLSSAPDSDNELNRDGAVRAGRKRKTSEESPANKANAPRQKITRACDSCKEKKTRCTGTLPCGRCTRLSLACEYNAAYSRGLPPQPPPAPASVAARYSRNRSASRVSISQSPVSLRSPPARESSRTTRTPRSQISQTSVEVSPRRNSPDPVATDFEGNYLGPASGVSFLNRVWRRLHQDETSAVPDELQSEWCPKNTSVFMFGDKPYTDYRNAGFTLPAFDKALELVGRYFDYAMVTYRFLHRGSVEEWLRQVYSHNISSSNLPTGPLVARTSIILMIFAVSTLHEEQTQGDQAESSSERYAYNNPTSSRILTHSFAVRGGMPHRNRCSQWNSDLRVSRPFKHDWVSVFTFFLLHGPTNAGIHLALPYNWSRLLACIDGVHLNCPRRESRI